MVGIKEMELSLPKEFAAKFRLDAIKRRWANMNREGTRADVKCGVWFLIWNLKSGVYHHFAFLTRANLSPLAAFC